MSVAHMSAHEREEVETHEQRALGFWLYLMGDAVIFALLFATYAIMIPGTAGGPTGKELFELDNAAIETALLLVSSMTFGFASLQVKAGNRGAVLAWLAITFLLGAGRVIRGWDDGVAGMKVGGKRVLLIPSDLAYGRDGAGGVIPPNASLVFEVELLDVKPH